MLVLLASWYKRILRYSFFFVLVILTMMSCQKETPPVNSPDARDKFASNWLCDESSSLNGSNPSFNVYIYKSTINNYQILLENFYSLGTANKAIADVVKDSLYLYPQIVGGNTVQGSGKWVNANTLNMTYSVNDGAQTDNITATFTK